MLLTWLEKTVDGLFAVIPRSTPQFNGANDARLIAHRGAHDSNKGIVENTLEAFRWAKKLGCWGLEFDLHATADSVLVVNHDATLRRLWGHDVAIADLTYSQLRALEPGIPSFAEVIAEFGGAMHLFIELKAPFQDEAALEAALQGLIPCVDYHLLVLEASTCDVLLQFPKQALLLVAVHNNVKEYCELSLNKKYGGVLANYLLLTSKSISKLQEANQVLGVGFVNSKNSLYRELTRGVKWLFTNRAEKVSYHLGQLQTTLKL